MPIRDPLLLAQASFALLRANARYWPSIAPLVGSQLDYWVQRADEIPCLHLKRIALTNYQTEKFNVLATATLATLAPSRLRIPVTRAIVALQILYDYLDSLTEQSLENPLQDARNIYTALNRAFHPNAPHGMDSRGPMIHHDDGGYMSELVHVIQCSLMELPRFSAVASVCHAVVERCVEAQVRGHATLTLGDTQLQEWALQNTPSNGLQWQEFLAGAVSSGLALHALIALASDARTTHAEAVAVDDLYLRVCAFTTLLDSLVDYREDLRTTGHRGYTRYYPTDDAVWQGITRTVHGTLASARRAPNGGHHLMTFIGIAAFYLSTSTALERHYEELSHRLRRELRPLLPPTLGLLRSWRRVDLALAALDSRKRTH